MNNRTLKVTGKGKLAVKPDLTRVLLTVEGTNKNYDFALSKATQATEGLKQLFAALGFCEGALKTTSFDINTEYENYLDDKTSTWKNKFKGYKYVLGLKVEFDVNNELLGKVLYGLSKDASKPEFRILYTVKDKEACRNELLCKAVEDSKAKAEALSKASGVKLGEIVNIDYSWSEIDIYSEPMSRNGEMRLCKEASMTADSYSINIETDDIELTDTVTVIWEIQ